MGYKYFFIIILFLCPYFSFSLENSLKKINEISAVIGNEIILNSEVKHYLDYSNNKNFCQGLENLIIQKLILYHAKIDPEIQIFNQSNQEEESDYSSYYNNENDPTIQKYFSLEEFIEKMKENQSIKKYNQKIVKNVEVSPEEVRSFFLKEKKSLPKVPKKFWISYMDFYPKKSKVNRKKIIDFLKKIKNEIHSDVDFSMKAILLSEDIPSAFKGGLMKGIKKENISKEFERIVFSLKEKEISEPFETNLGFHLVQLEKKIGDKIDIRHILIKHKYTKEELSKTKSFISLIKKRIINHKIFPKTVLLDNILKNRMEDQFINTFVWKKKLIEENHLTNKMKRILHSLKNGEISNPYKEVINGKETFLIVKLLEIIPSHSLSMEKDYPTLKMILTNIKKEHEIRNWAKNQLKKTYFKKIEKSCT
ncbi:peptidylprolyl isomerase [Blattabacterium cuenoti]|uniref:peptidylprolyl isomerase n=1 Tax=Blattabacterium cuenoti TaxID=1653831 RepID=UPI00163C5C1B|nr:peptidylprolyl isomerase [Blattabacterium cuenoti]